VLAGNNVHYVRQTPQQQQQWEQLLQAPGYALGAWMHRQGREFALQVEDGALVGPRLARALAHQTAEIDKRGVLQHMNAASLMLYSNTADSSARLAVVFGELAAQVNRNEGEAYDWLCSLHACVRMRL
jgi:hypothetical protein